MQNLIKAMYGIGNFFPRKALIKERWISNLCVLSQLFHVCQFISKFCPPRLVGKPAKEKKNKDIKKKEDKKDPTMPVLPAPKRRH